MAVGQFGLNLHEEISKLKKTHKIRKKVHYVRFS